MGNVIEFRRQDPHGSGEAKCLACGYEWATVVPIGETLLTCPSCECHKGVLKYPYGFTEGTLVRECNCGCQLFFLSIDGHMCANCGTYQRY